VRLLPAIAALLLASPAYGQLVVTGGASSLFRAQGGGATYYRGDTQTDVGIGLYQGRFVIGADSRWRWHGCQIIAGDYSEYLSTIGAGLAVANRGGALECGKPKKQTVRFFVGEAGQFYSVPFFAATGNTGKFGAGVSYQKFIGNLELDYVAAVAGNQWAFLQGARYRRKKWSVDEAAGLTTLGGYFQGDASYSAAHFAAQITHAAFVGKTEYTSEGISAGAGPLAMFASAFQSPAHTGEAIGATVSHGSASATVDVLFSKQRQVVGFLTEHGRHWMLTQSVSHSTGTSAAFGGGYTGNTLSASVSYQEVFSPTGGFQRATTVQVGLQLPRFTLHLSLDVLPSGITYTGYGTAYVRGPALSTGQATAMAE